MAPQVWPETAPDYTRVHKSLLSLHYNVNTSSYCSYGRYEICFAQLLGSHFLHIEMLSFFYFYRRFNLIH